MKADTLSESHRAKLQKNTEQEMFHLDFPFVPFLQYPQGHSQNIKQDHMNLQADPWMVWIKGLVLLVLKLYMLCQLNLSGSTSSGDVILKAYLHNSEKENIQSESMDKGNFSV